MRLFSDLNHRVQPKQVFLLDGIGAFFSAILLFAVVGQWDAEFGMPRKVCFGLSAIALFMGFFSGGCFLFAGKHWRFFLGLVALINLLYCCLTAGLVAQNLSILTNWGIGYFFLEIVVILFLVRIEFGMVKKRN